MNVAASQPTVASPVAELAEPLLEVRDLKVHFPFARGPIFRRAHGFIRAVDGVSFTIGPGETLGLVGESGCGKTTLARAIVGLAPVTSGEVRWRGARIDGLGAARMRPFRRHIQMVFQDPLASLNPRMTVERIVGEPLK